jgi:hypothetical protein
MSLKHISFHQSEVMRSLERQAVKAGHFEPSPEDIVKSAAVRVNVPVPSYKPSSNLYNDLMKLASGLRARGFESHANDIEQNVMLLKTAETHLYRVHDEDGVDVLNFAHPGGDAHVIDAQNELGNVETLIGTHMRFLEVARKQPTGQNSRVSQIAEEIKAEPSISAIASVIKKESGVAAWELAATQGTRAGGLLSRVLPFIAQRVGGGAAVGAAGLTLTPPVVATIAAVTLGVTIWGIYSALSKTPAGVVQWAEDFLDKLSELEDYEKHFPAVIAGVTNLKNAAEAYSQMGISSAEELANLTENSPIVVAARNYVEQLNFVKKQVPAYERSIQTLGRDDLPVFGMDEVKDALASLKMLDGEITKSQTEMQNLSSEIKSSLDKALAQRHAAQDIDKLIQSSQRIADYWASRIQDKTVDQKAGELNYNHALQFKEIFTNNAGKPFANLQADIEKSFGKKFNTLDEITTYINGVISKISSTKENIKKLADIFTEEPIVSQTPQTSTDPSQQAVQPEASAPKETAKPAVSARPTQAEKEAVMEMQQKMAEFAKLLPGMKDANTISNTGTGANQFDGEWGPKVIAGLNAINQIMQRFVVDPSVHFRNVPADTVIQKARANQAAIETIAQQQAQQVAQQPKQAVQFDVVGKELNEGNLEQTFSKGYRVTSQNLDSIESFLRFLEGFGIKAASNKINDIKKLAQTIGRQDPYGSGETYSGGGEKKPSVYSLADLDRAIKWFLQRAEQQGQAASTEQDKAKAQEYLAALQKLQQDWYKGPRKVLVEQAQDKSPENIAVDQQTIQIAQKPSEETGVARTRADVAEDVRSYTGQEIKDNLAALLNDPPFVHSDGTSKDVINIVNLLSKYTDAKGANKFYNDYLSTSILESRNWFSGNYNNIYPRYMNEAARAAIEGRPFHGNYLPPQSREWVKRSKQPLDPAIWFREIASRIKHDIGSISSGWTYEVLQIPAPSDREQRIKDRIIMKNNYEAQVWIQTLNTLINQAKPGR